MNAESQGKEEVFVGDYAELVVRQGKNYGQWISNTKDGRVAIFSRADPATFDLEDGLLVLAEITKTTPNTNIVRVVEVIRDLKIKKMDTQKVETKMGVVAQVSPPHLKPVHASAPTPKAIRDPTVTDFINKPKRAKFVNEIIGELVFETVKKNGVVFQGEIVQKYMELHNANYYTAQVGVSHNFSKYVKNGLLKEVSRSEHLHNREYKWRFFPGSRMAYVLNQ